MNISAIALGGLQQAQAEVERASKQAVSTNGPGVPVDAISLSHEAVALMVAKSQYEANLKAVEVAYALEKTALSTRTPSF
jgi:hypothetical protein